MYVCTYNTIQEYTYMYNRESYHIKTLGESYHNLFSLHCKSIQFERDINLKKLLCLPHCEKRERKRKMEERQRGINETYKSEREEGKWVARVYVYIYIYTYRRVEVYLGSRTSP